MKKHIVRILVLLLALVMPLGLMLPAFSEEELLYMAYNFYAGPDLSKTSGKFDTFLIDFYSDTTPRTTYWSLANFGMDLSSRQTKKTYPGLTGMGAYAGLQNTSNRMGILSFWDAKYREGTEQKILTATRVYPKGSSTFGGEGEGTNCIMPYAWKTGRWYRMMLHCWTNEETKTTYAGVWFMDVESGKWTLFSYFDTHLYDSYFIGGMTQFMENFSGGDVNTNCNVERTCHLKNMYVFDHVKKDWISLPTATLSYGDGGPQNEDQKKYGAHSFGATDEYFWGSTGGKVEDQAAYEAAAVKSQTYTITQPDKPTFGSPSINMLTLNTASKRLIWTLGEDSTPMFSYKIVAYNTEGEKVYEHSANSPEVISEVLQGVTDTALRCTLEITDLFGKTASAEYETKAYKEAMGTAEDPTEPAEPTEPTEPAEQTEPTAEPTAEPAVEPGTEQKAEPDPKDPGTSGGGLPVPAIVAIVAGAVLVVGGTAAAVIVKKKKKK